MSRREAEEKQKESKKARGARWEGEKENFPLPIVPLALSIFSVIAIFIGILRGLFEQLDPRLHRGNVKVERDSTSAPLTLRATLHTLFSLSRYLYMRTHVKFCTRK